MTLEAAVQNAVQGFQHTPNDLVLVADTNFLVRLSRRDVWAYQALLMTQSIANQKGKRWLWRAPGEVMAKYNYFLANGTLDENYKIPLAQCSLEELFGDFSGLSLIVAPVSILSAKNAAPVSGREDISVITFADGLARQGVEVYLASYDIKDVIAGVKRWNKKHADRGLKIEPLPPSPVQLQYFVEKKLELKELVTLDVLAQLQTAQTSSLSYPVVIFENGIRSGDAIFDAGVGVVQREYFIPLEKQLPPKFDSIHSNFRAVPVLKVEATDSPSFAKKVREFARSHNVSKLIVVEEETPYAPLMFSTFGPRQHVLTAGLDFLYWQTGKISAFAQANYKPVAQRVSIPK